MTSYWLSDPCSLKNSMNINPFISNDKNFNFNSLTRLIILVTLLSSILNVEISGQILAAGTISICLTLFIYLTTYNST